MIENFQIHEGMPVNEGANRILRVGGGVRACVFPIDIDNPQHTGDQVIALAKHRRENPMPFDENPTIES